MLFFLSGSIFNSAHQTIVNPIDLTGAMGADLALKFVERFPELKAQYQVNHKNGHMQPGKLWLYKHTTTFPWVLCFPTKHHWSEPASLELIELGLKKFVDTYSVKGIAEISFPKLGCGLGGLEWSDVKPMMIRYLDQVDIPVTVYV